MDAALPGEHHPARVEVRAFLEEHPDPNPGQLAAAKGYAFPASEQEYASFASDFEFEETPDQHDAYTIAAWLSGHDRFGRLEGFFTPRLEPHDRTIAGVEGWILGVG